MAYTTITNIRGPEGPQGPDGLPGTNAIPTDAAVAAYVSTAGSSATKTAVRDAARLAMRDLTLNVRDFGAVGDGVTDDSAAFMAALAAADAAGGAEVFIPAGLWFVSVELKVPSFTTLRGAGIDATIIKAMPGMNRHLNVITNKSNNRAYRTDYDKNIRISDLTVHGNWAARVNDGTPWEGNASGVLLSTVHDSIIERVKVIEAPLHCFAVEASRLPMTGDDAQDFYVPGPSYNVTIRDCIAINPGVDDGFTTHYSHDIVIERCTASLLVPPNTASTAGQNAFEVDDGSWAVTVRDCYATGFEFGARAKGHPTNPAAKDVVFSRMRIDGCGIGIGLGGGPHGYAPARVLIEGCEITNLDETIPDGTTTAPGTSVQIFGYSDVTIRDLFVHDTKNGGIVMSPYGAVTIDGVYAREVYRDHGLGNSTGFIRITGDTSSGARVMIRNVFVSGTIVGNLIRSTATFNIALDVNNVRAAGDGNSPMVSDVEFSTLRNYRNLFRTGFSDAIEYRSGASAGTWLENIDVLRGTLSPEGKLAANLGTLYLQTSGGVGSLWLKASGGSGATGWTQK